MRPSRILSGFGFAAVMLFNADAFAICDTPIDFSGKWRLTEKDTLFEDTYTIIISNKGRDTEISRMKVDRNDYDSEKISYDKIKASGRNLKVMGEHPSRSSFILNLGFDPSFETVSGTIKYQSEFMAKNISGQRSSASRQSRQETRLECLERKVVEAQELVREANNERDSAIVKTEELRRRMSFEAEKSDSRLKATQLNMNMRLSEETDRIKKLMWENTTLLERQSNSTKKKLQKKLSEQEAQARKEKERISGELENERNRVNDLRNSTTSLSDSIDQLTSMTTMLRGKIGTLSEELKKSRQNLAAEKRKPPRIFSAPLFKDFTAGKDTKVHFKPEKRTKVLANIKHGTILASIAELPTRGWSLVALENGIIGYVPSDVLIQRRDAFEARAPSEPEEDDKDTTVQPIKIDYPKWARGRQNQQITLGGPGLISLEGHIDTKVGIKSLTVNKSPADLFGDNTFSAPLSVEKTITKIKIVAIDNKGKVLTHEFEIRITSP